LLRLYRKTGTSRIVLILFMSTNPLTFFSVG
jgi:hypothetical protein